MAAETLALAIPTYNRPEALGMTLGGLAPALRELGIAVHVLDDSSDDATATVMGRLRQQGLEITYVHNVPALRHDRNVVAALQAPQADYVWLLGDGALVDEQALRRVHAALKGDDFVFLNCRSDTPTPSLRFGAAEVRAFLARQAWAMTYTGATVYSRRVVDWWRSQPRTVARNFPQLSVVLGFVAAHAEVSAAWVGERIIAANPRRSGSYWLADAVSVWGTDWHRVVTDHAAAFDAQAVPSVLRSHSAHTGILGAKHLLALRAIDRYAGAMLSDSGNVLAQCSTVPRWGLQLIAALPLGLASAVLRARPSWRRRYLPQAAAA